LGNFGKKVAPDSYTSHTLSKSFQSGILNKAFNFFFSFDFLFLTSLLLLFSDFDFAFAKGDGEDDLNDEDVD
jgi:hypothetical protein